MKTRECLICGEPISASTNSWLGRRFVAHLSDHQIDQRTYAIEYLKVDHNCVICGDESTFLSREYKFTECCSHSCSNKLKYQDEDYMSNHREQSSKTMTQMHQNPEFAAKISVNGKEVSSRPETMKLRRQLCNQNTINSHDKSDIAHLYVIELDEQFCKVGVGSNSRINEILSKSSVKRHSILDSGTYEKMFSKESALLESTTYPEDNPYRFSGYTEVRLISEIN